MIRCFSSAGPPALGAHIVLAWESFLAASAQLEQGISPLRSPAALPDPVAMDGPDPGW